MINIELNSIVLRGTSYPILRWEVWFQTPLGVATDLTDAKERLTSCDLSPTLNIIPVAVAIGPDDIYEVCCK